MPIEKCKDIIKRRTRNMSNAPSVEKVYVKTDGATVHVAFVCTRQLSEEERSALELKLKRAFEDIEGLITYVYNPKTYQAKLEGYTRIWRKGYGFTI